jgi:hypothetical protein
MNCRQVLTVSGPGAGDGDDAGEGVHIHGHADDPGLELLSAELEEPLTEPASGLGLAAEAMVRRWRTARVAGRARVAARNMLFGGGGGGVREPRSVEHRSGSGSCCWLVMVLSSIDARFLYSAGARQRTPWSHGGSVAAWASCIVCDCCHDCCLGPCLGSGSHARPMGPATLSILASIVQIPARVALPSRQWLPDKGGAGSATPHKQAVDLALPPGCAG